MQTRNFSSSCEYFSSCDRELRPMTFFFELDLDRIKMDQPSISKVICGPDTHTHRTYCLTWTIIKWPATSQAVSVHMTDFGVYIVKSGKQRGIRLACLRAYCKYFTDDQVHCIDYWQVIDNCYRWRRAACTVPMQHVRLDRRTQQCGL